MDRVAAATIVARSHIPLARVLARSFKEHHPEIPFFVLLADGDGGAFFDPDKEPFQLLGLDDLSVPAPERFLFNYTKQELSYACTPYLLRALLDRGFSAAAFFKQESLVLDDLGPVLTRMTRDSITMTPHLLEPLGTEDGAGRELNILQSGIFNVGFLGTSDTPVARRFLDWWQDRVFWHCRHDVPGGMHFEQRWLDLAPIYFEDVHLVRDPGFNVGHWNLPEREVRGCAGDLTAGGSRLRFMRFSGFDPQRPEAITRYHERLDMRDIGPGADLFRLYARLLMDAGYEEASRWPFAFACFDNDVVIPDVARQLYREMGGEAAVFGDPFRAAGAGSFFEWLRRPLKEGLTHIWEGVYQRRPDVRAAFPDHTGAGREGFLDWAARYGMKEHCIPEEFHPYRVERPDG